MLGTRPGGGSTNSRFREVLLRWNSYFPSLECTEFEQRVQIAYALIDFFLARQSWVDTPEVRQHGRVTLNFTRLESEVPVADFAVALRDEPSTVLGCLALAAHVTLDRLRIVIPFPKVIVRIANCTNIIPVRSVKANYLEKFVSIRGTVTRVGSVRPLVKSMTFECGLCGHRETCAFPDGQYSPPVVCAGNDGRCRNQILNPDRSTAIAVDWQLLRVQEQLTPDHVDMGRIPRAIDCELTEDLVDGAPPGEVVIISGIVKARRPEGGRGGRFGGGGRNKSLFVLYIDVNSVSSVNGTNNTGATDHGSEFSAWSDFGFVGSGFENLPGMSLTDALLNRNSASQTSSASGDAGTPSPSLRLSTSSSGSQVSFAEQDLRAVADIAMQPDLVKLLVHSFCPSIYGLEMVKFAILLTLMGGTQRQMSSVVKNPVRSDIHLLIVGDPGLGKSQLLRSAAKLAPRGVYIAGNAATNAGLTVTLHRDGRDGDYSLEPGALVIADRGVCCIDELDKMTGEQNALLEAMEQQTVSVAKAGIVCQLMARTSVLAAANPTGGHYDKLKTVAENLKMGMPLLSRFDLTFILLDRPNIMRDLHLSEHVVSMHGGSAGSKPTVLPTQQRHSNVESITQAEFSSQIPAHVSQQSNQAQNTNAHNSSIFHTAFSQATATPARSRPTQHVPRSVGGASAQFGSDLSAGMGRLAKRLPFGDDGDTTDGSISSQFGQFEQPGLGARRSLREGPRGNDSTTDIFSDSEEGDRSSRVSSQFKRLKHAVDDGYTTSDTDASLFAHPTRNTSSHPSAHNLRDGTSGTFESDRAHPNRSHRRRGNLLLPIAFKHVPPPEKVLEMLDECYYREQQAAELAASKPLSERLTLTPYDRQTLEVLPAVLLRKYIMYAREHVHPKLTHSARRVLESFFLRLRKESRLGGEGFTPVTTRQLEALIRLTEARAKLELREVATAADAIDVVDLMKESLFDVFSDDAGCVDLRRTTGLSRAKQANFFIAALRRIANAEGRNVFTIQELKAVARKNNLDVPDFETFIESLNNQNLLLSKGNRRYQLQAM